MFRLFPAAFKNIPKKRILKKKKQKTRDFLSQVKIEKKQNKTGLRENTHTHTHTHTQTRGFNLCCPKVT